MRYEACIPLYHPHPMVYLHWAAEAGGWCVAVVALFFLFVALNRPHRASERFHPWRRD